MEAYKDFLTGIEKDSHGVYSVTSSATSQSRGGAAEQDLAEQDGNQGVGLNDIWVHLGAGDAAECNAKSEYEGHKVERLTKATAEDQEIERNVRRTSSPLTSVDMSKVPSAAAGTECLAFSRPVNKTRINRQYVLRVDRLDVHLADEAAADFKWLVIGDCAIIDKNNVANEGDGIGFVIVETQDRDMEIEENEDEGWALL